MLAAPGWGCSQVSVAAVMIRLSQSRWFPWRRHLSRCACQHLHHHPRQQQLATLDRTVCPTRAKWVRPHREFGGCRPKACCCCHCCYCQHGALWENCNSYWVLLFRWMFWDPYPSGRTGHNPQALPVQQHVLSRASQQKKGDEEDSKAPPSPLMYVQVKPAAVCVSCL